MNNFFNSLCHESSERCGDFIRKYCMSWVLNQLLFIDSSTGPEFFIVNVLGVHRTRNVLKKQKLEIHKLRISYFFVKKSHFFSTKFEIANIYNISNTANIYLHSPMYFRYIQIYSHS